MDVQYLELDGSTCYTKGHVDKQKFIEAMALESGISIEDLGIKLEEVKHTLARIMPVRDPQAWGADYFVYFNQEKKRGAFPATYVDL